MPLWFKVVFNTKFSFFLQNLQFYANIYVTNKTKEIKREKKNVPKTEMKENVNGSSQIIGSLESITRLGEMSYNKIR